MFDPGGIRRWVRGRPGRWAWLVVALLLALVAGDLLRVWHITNHHDLDVFVLAARRLASGDDIYADAPPFKALIESGGFSMKDDSVSWPYAYAPLIAILFVPALWVSYPVVQALWWGLNLLALLCGCWLCLKAMGSATPARVAVVLLTLYRFEPAIVTLRLGQIELVQFLLLAVTLFALNGGRERWAGVALGLATGLKFFPGALVGLLVWRRRWRAAAWATGTALVTIVASFAVVGFEALPAYLDYTSIYGIGGAFAAFPFNQSLNGFLSRNLIRNPFNPTIKGVHLPWLARGLTLACSATIIVVSAWLTWPRRGWPQEASEAERRRFSLEFALAVVALLLVSPHSQVYTFVWVLLPLIILAVCLLSESVSYWWQWGLLFVAYLLLGRQYVLFQPGLTRFVQSHYMFGALLLWAMTGFVLSRGRRVRRDLYLAG